MGFPFDTPTWDGVSGAIFIGMGSSAPGIYSLIAIVMCLAALFLGQGKESSKYKSHK
ncbi:MAG: hypothetical protein RIG84_12390 [Roseovarius sp.]